MILEILEFIFDDFWHFSGVLVLLLIIFEGIDQIIFTLKDKGNKHD